MPLFARFQAIDENHKASVVRRLMESSTPDFDFFYLSGLAVLMATFGLLIDSTAVVIGSMLIAPLLYPILGVALGFVMSDITVIGRSLLTLSKSFGLGIVLAVIATLLFGGDIGTNLTPEIFARTDATLISIAVAIVAGLAVSYSLARPEWNESLPGIAISVALIPPLAVVGIGLAEFNIVVVKGSLLLLGVNVAGIVAAATVSFSLMNLHDKLYIAQSTIKREEERIEEEDAVVDGIKKGNTVNH